MGTTSTQTRVKRSDLGRPRFTKAYGFGIVTAVMFLLAWSGQFIAQAITIRNDAEQHGQAFEWSQFWPQFLSSTLENWQSEFLQLVWQSVGLAVLFLWGSSQSKESDERLEAKVDRLLEAHGVDPDDLTRQVNSSL